MSQTKSWRKPGDTAARLCKHDHDGDKIIIKYEEYYHDGSLRQDRAVSEARFVYPVNVVCVYRASGHTGSASVLCALHTAAAGGCVQAKSPTETTTHIKGVPLVEYD